MKVAYQNLDKLHQPHTSDYQEAIAEVIHSGAFSGGRFVENFETNFANYCGSRYCIGVGSGTEALWLSLLACDIGPGDEVITVANTYPATIEAIVLTGATPVFVDIEQDSFLLDPALLETALSSRTKAIIPVHLYGQVARMELINEFAKTHHLRVIEDASQAHGATRFGQRAGSTGDLGCFSFYPGKNLGAFGEAGAITTNSSELAQRIQSLRNHGQTQRNQHSHFGWNCRMDSIQAEVLRLKLVHLDDWNQRRRDISHRYRENLVKAPIRCSLPQTTSGNEHVFHAFVIRVSERDSFQKHLSQAGIETLIHYPTPVHFHEAYRHLKSSSNPLPNTEKASTQILSLPIHPHLSVDEITYITTHINHASIQSLAA